MSIDVRARFPDLPPRLAKLPVSDKGFPVPWFVATINGKPDFRVVEAGKVQRALKFNLCWVCGEPMGVHKAFVIGPMCGITRTISDPPSHRDCAVWSAKNCPFLSRPLAQRNTRDLPDERMAAAGVGLSRNPGTVGVWSTKTFKPFRAPRSTGGVGLLFSMGDPSEIQWFSNGRDATRAEIDHSVETGLPHLVDAAKAEGGAAVAALEREIGRFHALLQADPRTFEPA